MRRHSGVARERAPATAWTGILPAADLAAVVRDAIVVQRVAPHLRLALARPGNAWRASSGVAAAAPRVARVRVPVAATLGQMAPREPGGALAAAAAADPVGALDPARLVRALAAVGELDEAAAVAKLFGVSVKDGMR